MRSWIVHTLAMLVLTGIANFGLGQPSNRDGKLYFPIGNWQSSEFKLRPARRLSLEEAQKWVAAIKERGTMYSTYLTPVDPKSLIESATADHKHLAENINSRKLDLRLASLAEIALRNEKSLIPEVRRLAIEGDLTGFLVYRALDPSKAGMLSIYGATKDGSRTKDQAAVQLLRWGDTRGVKVIRHAMKTQRGFGVFTGAGWLTDPEVTYLLIRNADGNDSAQITKDLDGAQPQIRRYFPLLASLKRQGIDKVLLKRAGDPHHEVRKWVAVAAQSRPDSVGYRTALERLAKDPIPDVASTARWALGKGPKPSNLNHVIKN